MKPAAWYSRRVVDPVNSVSWFAMDGLWLSQMSVPAYLATAVTLVTGGMLLLMNRRRGQRLNDDLALNAWMWTNALWLFSDLGERPIARSLAFATGTLGALLLANAVLPSSHRRTALRHFTKLRLPGR